jgi:hypothetical protein
VFARQEEFPEAMSMVGRSWVNAEIYDRFVREQPIYGWLNRVLVRLADVQRFERIFGLACGTGATTLACLDEMAPDATASPRSAVSVASTRASRTD